MKETAFMTVPECSAEYGFHRLQLYRQIKTGRIPLGVHTWVGGRVYLHRRRFDEWLSMGGTSVDVDRRSETDTAASG